MDRGDFGHCPGELFEFVGVGGEFRADDLERDLAARLEIAGAEGDAVIAAPEHRADFEMPERAAGQLIEMGPVEFGGRRRAGVLVLVGGRGRFGRRLLDLDDFFGSSVADWDDFLDLDDLFGVLDFFEALDRLDLHGLGVQAQVRIAHADHIARAQFLLADFLTIEKRVAVVCERGQQHALVLDIDLTVDSGHDQVIQANIRIFVAVAEDARPAVRQGEVTTGVGSIDNQ